MEEIQPTEPQMHREQIELSDGRYLIYYSFDEEVSQNAHVSKEELSTDDQQ